MKKNWGGGIELNILSSFFTIQISVFDIKNLKNLNFGEDKRYDEVIYLLFYTKNVLLWMFIK